MELIKDTLLSKSAKPFKLFQSCSKCRKRIRPLKRARKRPMNAHRKEFRVSLKLVGVIMMLLYKGPHKRLSCGSAQRSSEV